MERSLTAYCLASVLTFNICVHSSFRKPRPFIFLRPGCRQEIYFQCPLLKLGCIDGYSSNWFLPAWVELPFAHGYPCDLALAVDQCFSQFSCDWLTSYSPELGPPSLATLFHLEWPPFYLPVCQFSLGFATTNNSAPIFTVTVILTIDPHARWLGEKHDFEHLKMWLSYCPLNLPGVPMESICCWRRFNLARRSSIIVFWSRGSEKLTPWPQIKALLSTGA